MFKKIIIATDLSAASDVVIECMSGFKSLGVEEVILFYSTYQSYNDVMVMALADNKYPDEQLYLNKQLQKLEKQGFKATLEIVKGIPAEALKNVAKQKDVSLIVIGAQGKSSESDVIFHLFNLGGVTSEILQSHEKPLLLVRTRIINKDGDRKFIPLCNNNFKEKILFATDFSDISIKALDYVARLVEDGCKKVTLLHVQNKVHIEKYLSDKLEDFNRIDNSRLEMHKQLLISKGAEEVEIKLQYGIPAEEIIEESKNNYSLIVMGSQGKGFFNKIFIGSVSQNVAWNTDVSLLLIPSDNR